jgi:hypothetical protein
MRRRGRGARGEAGHALFVVMGALTLLSFIASTFLMTTAGEQTLASNSAAGAKALYLAEAGIERARKAINAGGADDIAQVLSPDRGGALGFGRDVRFGGGTYDVVVTNNTAALGAVPADPGGANVDTDQIVVVTSTGRAGPASRVVAAVLGRDPNLTLRFPAAITLPGVEADSRFNGNSFIVCGRDTGPAQTDCPPPAPADHYAIVTRTATVAAVTGAISTSQQNNFRGAGSEPSVYGDDATLTSAGVTSFAAAVATAAPPANRYTVGCSSRSFSSVTWGSASAPGVYYLKGTCPGSSDFSFSGNTTGYGVLVVDSADLRITGNFRWEGPIFVTGPLVGFGLLGGGSQAIYGAVVINETQGDGPGLREDVLSGNAKIYYSGGPIRAAMGALNPFALVSWSTP